MREREKEGERGKEESVREETERVKAERESGVRHGCSARRWRETY